MNRATIYSIAQELGVSASTVSRAFSRPDLVRDSVREQIVATAQRLGYQPNRFARGLATGRTGLIGLLVPDITNPFFPPVVRAIEQAAAGRDTDVLLADAGVDGMAEPALIERLRAQVDGLLIASPRASSAALKEAIAGTPAVVINRALQGLPSVVVDNTAALQQAAQYMADSGHRKIALLCGPASSWAASRRAKAVRRWAEDSDAELVELGPFEAQFDDGRTAAADIIASGATGVLAFDDLMACGVLAGLADHGRKVPDDISVVGCDDVLLARTVTPALSTVTAPIDELGRHAVQALAQVVAGEPVENVKLEGSLTLRGTTTPAG